MENAFGLRNIGAQHRFRQRLADSVCNILHLLGVVNPALLHKMKQLDDDKDADGDNRNQRNRRHLLYRK